MVESTEFFGFAMVEQEKNSMELEKMVDFTMVETEIRSVKIF